MNTKIRDWCPMDAAKCDKYMQEKYGKTLQEMYPWPEQYQAMHIQLFCQPYECIHAECLGGDIDQALQQALRNRLLPLETGWRRVLHLSYRSLHRLRGCLILTELVA